MRFNARRASFTLPGVTGTARVGRATAELLPRLRPGDVAVLAQADLDRGTATALIGAGVTGVVNAAPMISGRYANLGPDLLAEAGVVLIDQIGTDALTRIPDDAPVRLWDGKIYAVRADGADEVLATGRELDVDAVRHQMEHARSGLVPQMEVLARETGDFLRREQELLLHGRGLPALQTRVAGRPAVVVADAQHADLRTVAPFVRDQAPVVVAIGATADDLLALSWVPDVVVVTGGDPATVPSTDALRLATDVIVLAPRGVGAPELEAVEAGGAESLRVESTATAEDVALLTLDLLGADLVVGVGLRSRLEDFLDRDQAGGASTFATRLKVGSRLVDASALRTLYAGGTRPVHLVLVALTGLIAVLVAVAVTPVGQDVLHHLTHDLGRLR